MSLPPPAVAPRLPSMRPRLAAIALAIAGASVSALLWHRTSGAATACGLSGGCDVVQASAYARALGVPLPGLGTAGFLVAALVLGLQRSAHARTHTLVRLGLIAAAVTGATLLCIQAFILGAWCPVCVFIDLTAITLGSLAAFTPLAPLVAPLPVSRLLVPIGAGLVPAFAMHVLFAVPEPAQAPTVAAVEATNPDGTVQIVEYVDAQCTFCREQHARLAEVLAQLPELAVEVVVRHVPIASHPHAEYAAAVACCGEAQGRGESVLDALMRADDLSPTGCRREAKTAGIDLPALDACLNSTFVADRLRRDRQAATDLGVRALPTCVIGGRPLTGLQTTQTLRDAIVRTTTPPAPTTNTPRPSATTSRTTG